MYSLIFGYIKINLVNSFQAKGKTVSLLNFKAMANQLLSAERISNFLGIEVEGDSNRMVEFPDETDIVDTEESAGTSAT